MKINIGHKKPVRYKKSGNRKEVYKCLHYKRRKISNNRTLSFKNLEKEQQNKPNISRRKIKNIGIRAAVGKIRDGKPIENINKNKSCFLKRENKLTNP